ncbi:MAG: Ig-like domain-containing protein [Ruminococcus sp.]
MKYKKHLSIILVLVIVLSSSVIAVNAKSIKLNKTKITLNKGETYQLKLNVASPKIKWTSSKKTVATVTSKGKVTAKKKGTAKITAAVGKKKYTCTVKVETPKLNKSKLTLDVGKTAVLKVTGTSQKIIWSSSNKFVAVVSNGKVTAKNKGKVTITAKINKSKYKCNVTVNGVVEPTEPNTANTTNPTEPISESASEPTSENPTESPTEATEESINVEANLDKIIDSVKKYGTNGTADNSYLYEVSKETFNGHMCSWRINYNESKECVRLIGFIGEKTTDWYPPAIETQIYFYKSDLNNVDMTMWCSAQGQTKTTLQPNTYSFMDNLTFEVVAEPADSSIDMQELSNSNLVIALTYWNRILENSFNISLKDLGFKNIK